MITDEASARSYVSERCNAAAMDKMDRFVELLVAESAKQNLVARQSLGVVWQRHIADSAQLLEHVPRETGLWLDLGTGAGLPGIIIAIMRPELPIKLIESRKRRIEWLVHLVAELQLANCDVVGSRLELVESVPASVISARAFAPLATILDLAARFSTSDTFWLLPKGQSAAQELEALSERRKELFHVKQSLTDAESGIIVGKLR
ncbi:16S rRNA (guanine(527)-N(7))-methyltransferase RsmG [Allopontixanthobacter sediminis]|uniref:Ribosomal RNA small subunit methyltransferase G n=1 Tax=Allopontixanthobacter sediminis TaxID=1689985 RepID=A0A845B4V6_9SPHN|nr:16S rRNA (guanine(527)-N(7))-methyltransferase RsmG [Allopontixanthobacter sediminis]MXP44457.1 16S rRNA (guanine(527)-N(7))-methyltransferase RsmG [Allopontixanthobacter sediminis]